MEKVLSVNINLAKNRGESFLDRIIAFALTIGRVLIIVTEIIALSAFLYRFSLDKTLTDLNDRIIQEESVLKLLHTNEARFRNLQDRLSLESLLLQQGDALPKYLMDIVNFAPSDMQISTIAVAQDAARIQATVTSVESLTAFVNKLKTYPSITNVSIDRIDNQTQSAIISVNITAQLKKPKAAI